MIGEVLVPDKIRMETDLGMNALKNVTITHTGTPLIGRTSQYMSPIKNTVLFTNTLALTDIQKVT